MRLLIAVVCLTLTVSGCSTLKEIEPPKSLSKEATLGARTPTEDLLRSLPDAQKVITLSVYNFQDYTGQNKSSETPDYSRAVTQGGLAILKKALLDAGNHSWFRVLERGSLEHLLQERKIIRSIRQEYRTADGRKLPALGPLLYSGILLEGGIISYETNLVTGGAGARYLGIGGSSQYRRDMVTVYLRAVSVTTGEVLVSVNTSKTIYSTLVDGGIFKYVSFDKIVEGEAGFSFNEPPQLAVRQAIEMGVYALVIEGYAEGLWKFKDRNAGNKALLSYVDTYENVGEKARQTAARLSSRMVASTAVSQPRMTSPQAAVRKQITQRPPVAPASKAQTYGGKTIPTPAPKPNTLAQETRTAAKSTSRAQLRNQKRQVQAKPTPAAMPARRQTTQNYKSLPREIQNAKENVPNGWYVQIASYKLGDRAAAASMTSALSNAGYPVVVQKTSVHAIPYLRILVGPYPDQTVAQDNKNRVTRQAGSAAKGAFVKQIYHDMW